VMEELNSFSIQGLMQRHAAIGNELYHREVCRTSNNPLGDVAEFLFHKTFGWELETNSRAGFDAICKNFGKIQIKSRRISPRNNSLQAGDIRNLNNRLFDFLAGVVFNETYDVEFAMLIPHTLIEKSAINITHTNSSRIYLRRDWLEKDGVQDLTEEVRKTWRALNKHDDQ
jgi:hypothetical protein